MKKLCFSLSLVALATSTSPVAAQTYFSQFDSLGFLGNTPTRFSFPQSISGDGSTVVGLSKNASDQYEAFRWTSANGMVGLGFLNPSNPYSSAVGVSADGSVIVGISRSSRAGAPDEAFIWTSGTGMFGLGFINGGGASPQSLADAISADGSTVVGFSRNALDQGEAFRWTSGTGMTGLGFINGGGLSPQSYAFDVSGDGSVVVGYSKNASDNIEAFRWTAGTGMIGLGFLGGTNPFSYARGVSTNGAIVVGYSTNASGNLEAYRWTSATGMVGLGTLNGDISSAAYAISADGSVIVGWSSTTGFSNQVQPGEAFRWTATTGMQSISGILAMSGVTLGGWRLYDAAGVSSDGVIITGNGLDPNGFSQAWIVRIIQFDLPVNPGVTPPPPSHSGFISYPEMQATIQDTAKTILQSGASVISSLSDMRSVALEQCRPGRGDAGRFCIFATGTADFWSGGANLVNGSSLSGSTGAAFRLMPGLQLGVAFSAGQGNYDLRLGGRNEVTAYGGSAFVSYSQSGYEGLQVLAAGTVMQTDLDIYRNYRNGVSSIEQSKGSTRGYGSGALGRIGWGMRVLDRTWLTPFAELEWSLMRNKGYEETGGVFPFSFGSKRVTQTNLRLGAEARHQFNDVLTAFGSVAWGHRLSGEGSSLNGVMVGIFGMSSGKVSLRNDWAEATAGATWAFNPNIRLTGSVSTSIDSNSKPAASFRVGLAADF